MLIKGITSNKAMGKDWGTKIPNYHAQSTMIHFDSMISAWIKLLTTEIQNTFKRTGNDSVEVDIRVAPTNVTKTWIDGVPHDREEDILLRKTQEKAWDKFRFEYQPESSYAGPV